MPEAPNWQAYRVPHAWPPHRRASQRHSPVSRHARGATPSIAGGGPPANYGARSDARRRYRSTGSYPGLTRVARGEQRRALPGTWMPGVRPSATLGVGALPALRSVSRTMPKRPVTRSNAARTSPRANARPSCSVAVFVAVTAPSGGSRRRHAQPLISPRCLRPPDPGSLGACGVR